MAHLPRIPKLYREPTPEEETLINKVATEIRNTLFEYLNQWGATHPGVEHNPRWERIEKALIESHYSKPKAAEEKSDTPLKHFEITPLTTEKFKDKSNVALLQIFKAIKAAHTIHASITSPEHAEEYKKAYTNECYRLTTPVRTITDALSSLGPIVGLPSGYGPGSLADPDRGIVAQLTAIFEQLNNAKVPLALEVHTFVKENLSNPSVVDPSSLVCQFNQKNSNTSFAGILKTPAEPPTAPTAPSIAQGMA